VAFLKKAKAMVTHPRISSRGWGGVRKVATSGSPHNLTDQARKILGGPLDPAKYLITHCTIVASVDVDTVPGVELGNVKAGSGTLNRRYADYLIKPSCNQFVNNNGDSWSREVLMKSYRTFIGAHNFQEHVQIEDQSKGRVIDAVARDIGDSVYVDILVATDRGNTQLVRDIENSKLATLSMGCTTDFTLCTKCGHFAVDETELCDHIKYQKLNTFLDTSGNKRVIAELCGHKDYGETGGVQFIEASWVAVPAFSGAVMRNILDPAQVSEDQVRKVMASPVPVWSDDAIAKAASSVVGFEFGGGAGDEGSADPGEGEDPAGEAKEPPKAFADLEEAIYNVVKKRVHERIDKEVSQENVDKALASENSDWTNDTLNKEGGANRYRDAIHNVSRIASSDVALVEGIASVNHSFGVHVAQDVYRAVLKTGSPSKHDSLVSFLGACQKAAERDLSPAEFRVLVRVGTLLSVLEGRATPNCPLI
tara:strand:+ start:2367 stop:3803 length:1437 start_codon:yes stop_codon:yes gene_type:complete